MVKSLKQVAERKRYGVTLHSFDLMQPIDWTINLESRPLSPGRSENLNFHYVNRNKYTHVISDILLEPSWSDQRYGFNVDISVGPMEEADLPPTQLEIPKGIGGDQNVLFGVVIEGVNKYTKEQIGQATFWSDNPLSLNVSASTFTAFVSRSNHPKDEAITNLVHNRIRDWGFQTETLFQNVDDPISWLSNNIGRADCLFGIAVPRYQTIQGDRPQFHYLDAETGMALNRDIPVVIFEHADVDLKGIGKECLRVEFGEPNSEDFQRTLNSIMPQIREAIRQNRQSEFRQKVLKVGGAMLAGAILGGGVGSGSEAGEEM